MIWVFLLCTAFLVYAIVGWPLLLGLLARVSARAPLRDSVTRSVTVIIAVYNGERYLRAKLDSVFALDYPREQLEVFVVSDGSTDATDSIAESYPGVRLIRIEKGGKCRALNASIPQASGEILFLTDVRQELEPDCLRELVSYYADPKVGVVSGELLIRDGDTRGSKDVGLYWKLETWIRDRLSSLDSMFGATGPVYTIRRSLAVPVPEEILLDDMYLPLAAFFRGYRLKMAKGAIAWDYATSTNTEYIRKVRTLGGNFQLLRYYPQLLNPFGNRMWFHYVSYKLARMLMPWFLLGAAVGSYWLPEPWNWLVLAGFALAVVVAWADPGIPQGFPLKRLTSPLATFLTMMLAALMALRVFFVDPRSLWIVTSAKKDGKL
jgi:cellulose synthase/poly-beta-1,6-N-acetylglucosamine synthase-like glycosyltransferase